MLKIGNTKIGKGFKPKIIAEISANHNQSLKKALELIKKLLIMELILSKFNLIKQKI